MSLQKDIENKIVDVTPLLKIESKPMGPQLPIRTSAQEAQENGRRVRDYQRSHRPRVVANNTK